MRILEPDAVDLVGKHGTTGVEELWPLDGILEYTTSLRRCLTHALHGPELG